MSTGKLTATVKEENGEFYTAVSPPPNQDCWPGWLEELTVNFSKHLSLSGSYTNLIGFNLWWLESAKQQTLAVYAKSFPSMHKMGNTVHMGFRR